MTQGRLITLEGGEGAGKSTQTALLAEWLQGAGVPLLTTREPGGSPGAEQIRELLIHGDVARWDPMTEALLHFAARRDHLAKTVEPALAAGTWVISDRFTDSTKAYQGYGLQLGPAVIDRLCDLVLGGRKPDLTLILDLPVEAGLARAAARRGGATRYETMDLDFHRRLRDGFHAIAAAEPQRCILIDATRDTAEVQARLRAAVVEHLAPALT